MKTVKNTVFQLNLPQVIILGIVSSEPDYKLSWIINNTLEIGLSQTDDLIVATKNKTKKHFALYNYEDESENLTWQLVGNKSETGVLIKEVKNLDYFFQIYGAEKNDYIKSVIQQLKSIQEISAVISIDKIPNKTFNKILLK